MAKKLQVLISFYDRMPHIKNFMSPDERHLHINT